MVASAATAPSRAQESFDLRLFRPNVSVWFGGSPDRSFQSVDGEYGTRAIGIGANFPIGRTSFHTGTEHLLAHQVLLGATLSTTDQTIEPLDREPRLYAGGMTVTALFATRAGNLYTGSLGASFAEDEDTLDDLDTRLFALGLGTWKKSPELIFVYGGALTYLFGKKSILPAFGLIWHPTTDWIISGALPFSVRVTKRFSPDLRLNFLLYANGQRYRFLNDGTFPGQDEVVFQRMRESRLGAEIEYRPTRDLALLGQAGIAGGRRLAFADVGEEDFLDDTIDPAPYVKLGLRYAFGKSIVEGIAEEMGLPAPPEIR